MPGHLIIIGASARAAAQSAIRAGYQPWCIDLFADRDLQAIAPVRRCPRDQWPQGVMELMQDAPPGPVLLTGAMENHIEVVRALERERELLTGPSSAMEMLRSPRAAYQALMSYLQNGCKALDWREGIDSAPALHWDDDLALQLPDRWQQYITRQATQSASFLIKPRDAAGGRGIRLWSSGDEIGSGEYVQQVVRGRSLSATFCARDGMATLLGITEQLVGDVAFGAPTRFSYTGSLFPSAVSEDVRLQFQCAGRAMAQWSKYRGVFGLDVMLPDADAQADRPLNEGRIHIVDINPRYPASTELIERALPGLHVLGSSEPSTQIEPTNGRCYGKAIVYAKHHCQWASGLANDDVADRPGDGEEIEVGQPICTVFAEAATRDGCLAGLRDKASTIYTRLESQ